MIFSEWNHVPWISPDEDGTVLAETMPLLRLAALITCPSPVMQRQVSRITGIEPGKIRLVPHAVDIDFFKHDEESRQEIRSRLGLPPDATLFLHIGRFAEHKGYQVTAKALSILRERGYDAYLVKIGPMGTSFTVGDDHNKIWAGSGFDRQGVFFTGPLGRYQLPSYYSAADAMVFPTLAEAFGLVSVESMSCSTPVISYDIEPTSWVVSDTGSLVDPGSIEGLVSAMEQICIGGNHAVRMAKRARTRVEKHFSWPVVTSKYLDLYEEVVGMSGLS